MHLAQRRQKRTGFGFRPFDSIEGRSWKAICFVFPAAEGAKQARNQPTQGVELILRLQHAVDSKASCGFPTLSSPLPQNVQVLRRQETISPRVSGPLLVLFCSGSPLMLFLLLRYCTCLCFLTMLKKKCILFQEAWGVLKY